MKSAACTTVTAKTRRWRLKINHELNFVKSFTPTVTKQLRIIYAHRIYYGGRKGKDGIINHLSSLMSTIYMHASICMKGRCFLFSKWYVVMVAKAHHSKTVMGDGGAAVQQKS